ncbi:MAG: multiprotein bridging factor aMBF1 [Candidatus Thermoplasmatota archaeon]|nr:multiprotein bridging factor aMBF1 [Candidatus Thermoplasmatota archaeon]
MQCELCGNESSKCRLADVDGVRMMLCPSCMKHGRSVKEATVATTNNIQRSILTRIRRPKEKDVYEGMDRELVSNWGDLIRAARKRKGLSREQLGFNIGERTITIAKIENGDLRPPDKIAKKLEKNLSISLFEEVKKISTSSDGSHPGSLTLGDFIKTEDK